jgi:hypothetical protein
MLVLLAIYSAIRQRGRFASVHVGAQDHERADVIDQITRCFPCQFRSRWYSDLARINGDSSWTLPMPGRFLIDSDGVIAYAEVNADYTLRPDPKELLPVITRTQTTAYALRDSTYSVSA